MKWNFALRTSGWHLKGCRVSVSVRHCSARVYMDRAVGLYQPAGMDSPSDFWSIFLWCFFFVCSKRPLNRCSIRPRCTESPVWMFCVSWSISAKHAVFRVWTCPLNASFQLSTLCWKGMGDKLGLSREPTLLINTALWQGAPSDQK